MKDAGGLVALDQWMDYATVYADQIDVRGREFVAAASEGFEDMTRFNLRYRDGIKQGMRVLFGGISYNIIQVSDPDGRRRELRLTCREVVADGS